MSFEHTEILTNITGMSWNWVVNWSSNRGPSYNWFVDLSDDRYTTTGLGCDNKQFKCIIFCWYWYSNDYLWHFLRLQIKADILKFSFTPDIFYKVMDRIWKIVLPTIVPNKLLLHVLQASQIVFEMQGSWLSSYKSHSFIFFPKGELCIYFVQHN